MAVTHYRAIPATELAALAAGAGEYQALAAFGAVHAGDSGALAVLHVAGGDREGLPGTFLAAFAETLPEGVAADILRARWVPASDDDPGCGPVAATPKGSYVLETGIPPHTFA